jgi:hypothetical protein
MHNQAISLKARHKRSAMPPKSSTARKAGRHQGKGTEFYEKTMPSAMADIPILDRKPSPVLPTETSYPTTTTPSPTIPTGEARIPSPVVEPREPMPITSQASVPLFGAFSTTKDSFHAPPKATPFPNVAPLNWFRQTPEETAVNPVLP